MIRESGYLELPSGEKIPARLRRIAGGRSDAILSRTTASHSATVNRHDGIAEDIIVSDGVYQYRLVEFKEILDKYRLQLERL